MEAVDPGVIELNRSYGEGKGQIPGTFAALSALLPRRVLKVSIRACEMFYSLQPSA